MQYRQLGNSPLKVSQICLGTMTFGSRNTEAQAHSQLDLATERGVNFIDTAELYPAPASAETWSRTETIIGNWLQHKNRDSIILGSKVVGPAPRKWIGYIRNGPQLNRNQIEQALNDSLRRLQTDYLDLYQIHWPARHTNYFGKLGYEYGKDKHDSPIEETVEILSKLIASGKIRYAGVSNETPWGVHTYLSAAERLSAPAISSVQNPYCLLNRSYEIGLAEFAHRSGLGLLAYSPLAGGSLTGKYLSETPPANARLTLHRNYFYRYTTERAVAAIKEYVAVAANHHIDPATMALAFVNQQPFVTSTIVGATTLEQLQSNIDSVTTVLDDALIKEINEVHQRYPNPCP
ncbi:aldo/keto reductase [Chromatiales bacterium (ex Bugula neritina AB1)]|nr:aldo/keto reductase [Chromatiales bacterium (ex Bugula neritina AB1)]